ncbi:MAG: glycosyltransferase family 4 protein [Bacteroidetes bacterium]|nr:glycosyltransferase family 4 protein [Bacteroidota bacterium]
MSYHLYKAAIFGSLISRVLLIKRILTRHHASYNREYYPKAVKYDSFVNRLSTDIVAISENCKNELLHYESVPLNKITVIYHGLNFDDIDNISIEDVDSLRAKYNLTKSDLVIGVISRYIHLKGIQYIIPAFEKLLKEYPNTRLVLANTVGDYSNKIKQLLKESLTENSYREINFENNLFALFRMFNVFVHVPINSSCEAFGQTYIESLACGVPSIFTLSGIASEFIVDQKNALVVPYMDSEAIFNGMKRLINESNISVAIASKGEEDVRNIFDIKSTVRKLENLYLNHGI